MEIMSVYLTNILHKNVSDQPFYKRLIDIVPTLKHMTERSSAAQHREDIAFLYDKVRGINWKNFHFSFPIKSHDSVKKKLVVFKTCQSTLGLHFGAN